jgi:hypothetical protein
MARKIGFGILWFIAIYFIGCMLVGGVAGGIAGYHHQNSDAAGQAGASAITALQNYLLFGAAFISVIGSIKGFLPGTKQKSTDLKDEQIRA